MKLVLTNQLSSNLLLFSRAYRPVWFCRLPRSQTETPLSYCKKSGRAWEGGKAKRKRTLVLRARYQSLSLSARLCWQQKCKAPEEGQGLNCTQVLVMWNVFSVQPRFRMDVQVRNNSDFYLFPVNTRRTTVWRINWTSISTLGRGQNQPPWLCSAIDRLA